MEKIVVAIPHSHTWFWTQTCIASLVRNPPVAEDCEVEVVVINNSPWSPAIVGLYDTSILPKNTSMLKWSIIDNFKSNKFHASALDCIVETFNFDYLMAFETDVLALRPPWLQRFLDAHRSTDYAVGHWHHEQFVNPSCTLYAGEVLRRMMHWCKKRTPSDILYWGEQFKLQQPISVREPARDYKDWFNEQIDWIAGPFADKRGWAEGTVLKEAPSGQLKGPGWYEPGQMLHHWAVEAGYTYTVCPTLTTKRDDGVPLQTFYGASMPDPQRQLSAIEMFGNAETVHLWGGTRALDIIKHDVTCEFVKSNTPFWLAREAQFWLQTVPASIQAETLALIRKHGWHFKGQGTENVTDRDRTAAEYVRQCYEQGGVTW